jgi:dolichyl-phosphate-mannose--protein O-mannosyl transferase
MALRQLFHEIVAAVFGVLALAWLQSAFRAWTRDVPHWLVVLACLVALVLAGFSWSSFRRARQLR